MLLTFFRRGGAFAEQPGGRYLTSVTDIANPGRARAPGLKAFSLAFQPRQRRRRRLLYARADQAAPQRRGEAGEGG